MSGHLTDKDIADYLDDPEDPRRAEIEAHAAECKECRDTLEVAQNFDAEMDAALVWDFMVAAKRRATATPLDLIALADQIEAEEREATDYLALIVMSPRGFQRAAISEKAVLHTAGVVRVLCNASRTLREKNPKHALTIADAALAIAALLSPRSYDEVMRADLRAAAHLERANVLRYLGAFPDALRALDASEAEYRTTPIPERPLAMINYVRSLIYLKSERLDEAAMLARESARVFQMYGDDDRVVHARIVVGGCMFYRREYGLARDLFRRLVPQARAIDEPATEARCLSNLANAERELNEFAAALLHYSQAAEAYQRLGLRTEVLRARWGVAKLMVRMGNIPDGIARLRNTAGEMLTLGLTNDHALVMLDAARSLFAIGELEELPMICAELVRVFASSRMPENAHTALAYLEAAVSASAVSVPLIDSVTGYIERADYAAPFVPPPA